MKIYVIDEAVTNLFFSCYLETKIIERKRDGLQHVKGLKATLQNVSQIIKRTYTEGSLDANKNL